MLEIPARQFLEWKAFAELEPFGERRMDLRFAILAAVIAGSAGAKGMDGKPYTAHTFLRNFVFEEEEQTTPVPSPQTQSIEFMALLLNDWMDISNQALIEEHKSSRDKR